MGALPDIGARTVIDLGCGPGNSTEALAARYPDAVISGIDSSPDMIAAARRRLPRMRFEVMDIDEWQESGPFDVILANAVLQWLPNHTRLLPQLVAKLAAGGVLAIQMPDNLEDPAHKLMREIANEGPWVHKLVSAAAARTPIGSMSWYHALLRPICAKVDLWRTTYYHPLANPGAIVEWFKGSGLRPYLDPLDEAERAGYLDRYRAAVERAYPALPDGSVLLPFPRAFIVAIR